MVALIGLGNTSGYCKKFNKVVLMNYKGQILSEPYTRIQRINVLVNASENADYGIYAGLIVDDNQELKIKDLLDKVGQKIPLTIKRNTKTLDYEIEKFDNIDIIINNINKYGTGLIYFIPAKMFEQKPFYENLIKYYLSATISSKGDVFYNNLSICMELAEFLSERLKINNIFDQDLAKIYECLDKNISNKIEREYLKNSLH